jgi:hypothetical protein
MAAAEVQLIYLFSGLLTFGAVFLAFVPALHHAWTFAASRRAFAVLLAAILGIGVAAVLLVTYAVSDPLDFLPIVLITVGLRMVSPFLLYRGIQDRFEAERWWVAARWLVAIAFLVLAAILLYHLVRLASGSRAQDFVLLSEQLIMALGASSLIVRGGLRIRPRDTPEIWPIWAAAILLALAFVVVLPYAIPTFEIVYVVSGLFGWTVGILTVLRDL